MTAGISLPSFGSRASGLWLTLFMLAPTILPALSSATPVEVLYGPEDKPLDRVVALYHRAHRYLYVAVYGLSNPGAVEALVAAKKRGVDVRIMPIASGWTTRNNGQPLMHCDWQAFPFG